MPKPIIDITPHDGSNFIEFDTDWRVKLLYAFFGLLLILWNIAGWSNSNYYYEKTRVAANKTISYVAPAVYTLRLNQAWQMFTRYMPNTNAVRIRIIDKDGNSRTWYEYGVEATGFSRVPKNRVSENFVGSTTPLTSMPDLVNRFQRYLCGRVATQPGDKVVFEEVTGLMPIYDKETKLYRAAEHPQPLVWKEVRRYQCHA